jgi:FAD/FMN-containing dehydrogenase
MIDPQTGTPAGVTLSEAALQTFRTNFRGPLLRPGDAEYNQVRKVWNGMIDRRPALIARCTGAADVIAAVNFAREQELLVAVRGSGHNVAGSAVCEGGLMIDLSLMRGVHVDAKARTARVQGGATWGDVDCETQVFGLATPGGQVSVTGVAGLTLGGGYGYLRRKHGLSCDNLLSVDIVTADGQLVVASESENADLFWAVRGGGGTLAS